MSRQSSIVPTVRPPTPAEAADPTRFEIVDGPLDVGHPMLPAEMNGEKIAILRLVSTDPAAALPTLVRWVEQYPAVPTVKSWLLNAYRLLGRTADADGIGTTSSADYTWPAGSWTAAISSTWRSF
jgi:hypothetical protein